MSAARPHLAAARRPPGVRHAFFTRQGGVSTGHLRQPERRRRLQRRSRPPWRENRRRVRRALRRRARRAHRLTRSIPPTPWSPTAPGRRDRPARRRRGHRHARRGLRRAGRRLRAGAAGRSRRPASSPPPTPAGRARWPASSRPPSRPWRRLGAEPRPHASPPSAPASARPPTRSALEFLERFTADDPAYARFFAPGAAPDKRMFDLPAFVLARLARGRRRRRRMDRPRHLRRGETCSSPTAAPSSRRAGLRPPDERDQFEMTLSHWERA